MNKLIRDVKFLWKGAWSQKNCQKFGGIKLQNLADDNHLTIYNQIRLYIVFQTVPNIRQIHFVLFDFPQKSTKSDGGFFVLTYLAAEAVPINIGQGHSGIADFRIHGGA